MNILILGSGGREHALAWAVKQNPKCDRLIVAPGNAGIAQIAECASLDILSGAQVVQFCEENAIDFVIVGPEAPLVLGVVDAFEAAGATYWALDADVGELAGLGEIAGTEEGRAAARAAIAYWRPRVAESFGAMNSARFETQKRFGLRHRPNEALRADWTASVAATLAPLGLE